MGSYGPSIREQAIDNAIHLHLQSFQKTPCGRENDLPFFVADTEKVAQQHRRWEHALPNVHPFYAVKCNPDPKLLQLLADMDVNFDCASIGEIEQVLDMGIDPSRIIFAHPCKAPSALDIAARSGVRWTTFDNFDELIKIQRISPKLELLLRIYVQDHTAKVALGDKFGAPIEIARALLQNARHLELKVVGVCFHIGSGATDPNAFVTAVQHAKYVFEDGISLGFDMQILDVGGGFEDNNFETMAYSLREAIAHQFKSPIRLIAEPGRFYASGFYTMACQVIARRVQKGATSKLPDMLYLNDGLYGCFSGKWTEGREYTPTLIESRGISAATSRDFKPCRYSIWGPTCDSMDCISKDLIMDQEIIVGDWLKFEDMGGKSHHHMCTISRSVREYDVAQLDAKPNIS
ncbi:unnamed protein product [Penicillium olsonii]|nr:unnamed protein product [Penicillium olsonii]CAG7922919.1 unnamed protein product [Penicillium olsonii]